MKDISAVDKDIPDIFSDFTRCLTTTVFTLIVICFLQPWFILPLVPILGAYIWIMEFYRRSSRELGRLVSIFSSPIYAQYQETLQGLQVVRAFDKQEKMKDENESCLNNFLKAYYIQFASNR